jgi:hypothetical protein
MLRAEDGVGVGKSVLLTTPCAAECMCVGELDSGEGRGGAAFVFDAESEVGLGGEAARFCAFSRALVIGWHRSLEGKQK